MRGQIIDYFEGSGSGLISGDDGQRYSFTADGIARREGMRLHAQVDFLPNGERARDIFPLSQPGFAPSQTQTQSGFGTRKPEFAKPRPTVSPGTGWSSSASRRDESLSLWDYFVKCLRLYVDGNGRARRKEYWGFALMSALIIGGLAAVGVVGILYLETLTAQGQGQGSPLHTTISIFSMIVLLAAGFAMLAFAPPSYAVTARRLHDIGQSGWLTLLILVPYVGGLIIFVFSVIPSQEMDNQYGPYPA